MKLNKKKVVALALAVCLIATLSLGSLAWFTDDDSVTNDFHIAGSEDSDPDDVFSVDVWEDATSEDPDGEEKIQDGIEFDNILPGDDLYKEVHIENTGAYPQYIRATITVTGASIWQDVYTERIVALDVLTNADLSGVHTMVSYYDVESDSFVYELYYNDILPVDGDMIVFDTVNIPVMLDRFQAAALQNFQISVEAHAVQTENVGENVYEAFETVGLVKAVAVADPTALADALQAEGEARIVLDPSVDWSASPMVVDYDISNKTIDANGQNAAFTITGLADNVVITGIVDTTEANAPSVDLSNTVAGSSVTVANSTLVSTGGTGGAAIKISKNCDLTIDSCTLTDDGSKNYAVYGFSGNNITVTNTTFEGFEKSWAMQINGTIFGDVKIDNCVFTDCKEGIFKGSVAGGGNNGLLNGDFTFTNNTLTNCAGHDGVETKMFTVKVTGTITVDGNIRDGVAYTPGTESGITSAN